MHIVCQDSETESRKSGQVFQRLANHSCFLFIKEWLSMEEGGDVALLHLSFVGDFIKEAH